MEDKEKKLSYLETEGEVLTKEAENEQKKAMIREAKQRYGKDWKKILFGAMKHIKVNQETMQSLHGLGVNDNLREMNDPRAFRRH